MNLRNVFALFLIGSISIAAKAQMDKESNFYTEVKNKGIVKNLVKDYKVGLDYDASGTSKLQSAVDEISGKGGGTIIIPKGNYAFTAISIKSNVHIVIDKKAVLQLKPEPKKNAIFLMGEKNKPTVKNVSITCSDEKAKYIVDFEHSGDEPAVVALGNVENFMIAGFEVKDFYTKFSSIRMGIDVYNGTYYYPTNGVVKNCSTINSHYGYGLIQSQAARNILFKDLSGIGGVTLRLETGARDVNNLQVGGNHSIVARNISCKNGNAAVMISPHALQNGTVDIDGVLGESCGFALRIEKGYIATKYDKSDKIKAGAYEKIVATNIKGIYGVEAQLKSKHFKYMPCALRSQIKDAPEETNRNLVATVPISVGPAIAAVMDTDQFPTEITNIEAVGFINKSILKDEDADNCGEAVKEEAKKEVKVKDKTKNKEEKMNNKEAKEGKVKKETKVKNG